MDDVSLETGLPAPSTLYSAHETLRAFDTALPEVGHCWKTGSWRAVEGHAAPTVDPPWLIWSSWQGSSLFGHEEGWHSQPAGQLLSHCFHTLCWQDGGDGALLLLPHACGVQLETLRVDNSRRRCARGGCSRGFEAVWLLLGLALAEQCCGCLGGVCQVPLIPLCNSRTSLALLGLPAPHPAPAAACAWRLTGAHSPTCC